MRTSQTKGYVPKIMLSIVVNDTDVERVVNEIISINHTGKSGEGKIMICPIEESLRVRTGDTGVASLL